MREAFDAGSIYHVPVASCGPFPQLSDANDNARASGTRVEATRIYLIDLESENLLAEFMHAYTTPCTRLDVLCILCML